MPIARRHALLGVLVVVGALTLWQVSAWRLGVITRQPLLPTRFDHGDHREVACTTCHHNFLDRSLGAGGCFRCHKVWGTTEARRIDVVFHAFCTDCHRERQAAGLEAGPVKSCAACHVAKP